ncbi:MAG: copper resistance CopC family protein, partial [Acidimicrobiia bacterium]
MGRIELMVSVVRRLSQVLVLCAILVSLGAAPALGHADLVSTDPADGQELSTPPEAIELVFTAAVEPIGTGVNIFGDDGGVVDATTSQPDGNRIVLTPVLPLANGGYTVDWTVASADSHIISGVFTFSVAAPVTPEAPEDGEDGTAAAPETPTTTAAVDPVLETTASDEVQDDEVVAIGPQFEALDATTGE